MSLGTDPLGSAPIIPFAATGRGEGAPTVLLSGLMESPAIWHPLKARLSSAGAEVHAMPLPGHAPWTRAEHPGPVSSDWLIRHYADTLSQIAARFGPVRLIGHSTGGLLALELARLHPELVSSVMVVGGLSAGHLGRRMTMLQRLVVSPVAGTAAVRMMMRIWCRSPKQFERGIRSVTMGGRLRFRDQARYLADMMKSDPDMMRAIAVWLAKVDVSGTLCELERAVTVVVCTQDPVVPPSHQLELARRIPNAETILVRSGHLPMLEVPRTFANLVTTWLRQPGRTVAA